MMDGERKLATIRRVAKIEPIEGADRIVKATIDGWELVTQKGNYQEGDLCVYFEIDSFLPLWEEFEFLRKGSFKNHPDLGEGFRIKTIKLRGQLSQGLSLPLGDFAVWNDDTNSWVFEGDITAEEGLDLTEYFGVKKYEKPEGGPGGSKFGPSASKGSFPDFIPKTDQERVQNCWGGVKNWIYYGKPEVHEIEDEWTKIELERHGTPVVAVAGVDYSYFKSGDQWFKKTLVRNDDDTVARRQSFEATVKMDGSSMTVYHNDGKIGVCSRNMELRRLEGNVFWKVAIQGEVLSSLVQMGRNVAIQGELMGPGVQGNREKLDDHQFFIFDVYDIDQKRYMTPDERAAFLSDFWLFVHPDSDVAMEVPSISRDFILSDDMTVKDFLDMAEGQSSWSNEVAEGIVFKSHEPGGPSFKVIANRFLLAEKD